MFPVTITLHNSAQLNAVLSAMTSVEAVENLETTLRAAAADQAATKKAKTDPKSDAAPASEPTPTASASSENSSTESTQVAESGEEGVAEQSTATYDDAKAAVLEVSKSKGREGAVELLQRFGVSRLPDLKPDQYGALVEHANNILAGAEV